MHRKFDSLLCKEAKLSILHHCDRRNKQIHLRQAVTLKAKKMPSGETKKRGGRRMIPKKPEARKQSSRKVNQVPPSVEIVHHSWEDKKKNVWKELKMN